jgi:hypothetical protein
MTSFSDQFSAVRQSQWETQLDLFHRLSTQALDNTEQLMALNMRASRASMEQATGAVKQMLDMRDPRDLFAVGSGAQGQWHQLFAYGRELLGIATGLRGTWSTLPPSLPFLPTVVLPALTVPSALRLIPAPADLPASPSQVAEQAAIAAADATTTIGEIQAAAADIGSAFVESTLDGDAEVVPSSEAAAATDFVPPAPAAVAESAEAATEAPAAEPAAEPATPIESDTPAEAALAFADAASDTAIADDVPPLEITPLVQALNEVAPKPASVEHPIVSTVPLEAAAGAIELPSVEPVEYTAPPAQPSRPPRVARKK